MINSAKLRARIVEKEMTIGSVAEKMNLSGYTLGQKISGKSIMTLDEADKLQSILGIDDKDFTAYFFAREVHNATI